MDPLPESQFKDSQLMRMLEQSQQQQPMSSSSQRVEKPFESLMDEDEDVFLLTRSTLNLLSEIWNSNKSMLQNLKVAVGFLQFYSMRQGKIDANTVRMREARVMRDAVVSVIDALKKKKRRGPSACSFEDLHVFLIEEKLAAVLSEDVMLENTFNEWLEDFKEFSSRRTTLRTDATATKSTSVVVGEALNALFSGVQHKEEESDERLPQYISRSENGRVQTVRTPGETGHTLIRLDIYEVCDILKQDKRDWWKYAKLRSQFLTSSTDSKYQLTKQLIDLAADDLSSISGVRKDQSRSSV